MEKVLPTYRNRLAPPTMQIVQESILYNQDYLLRTLRTFHTRLNGLRHKILIVGPGRSGKDTVAQWLSAKWLLPFTGSTSLSVLPLISYSLGMNPETCYADRHLNRMYWFDYCNLIRDIESSLLIKLTIANSDLLVGTRSFEEYNVALKLYNPSHVLWIERDVPIDPTMEYGKLDAGASAICNDSQFVTIVNNSDYFNLYKQLETLL